MKQTVKIIGTDEYKKSIYYGREFDKENTVHKYTRDFEEDSYEIVFTPK